MSEIKYRHCEPAEWPHWRCPDCRGLYYAKVDEQKPDHRFAPGPLIRCVNCKSVFDTRPPSPSPDPARPASYGEETMSADPDVLRETIAQFLYDEVKGAGGWSSLTDKQRDSWHFAAERLLAGPLSPIISALRAQNEGAAAMQWRPTGACSWSLTGSTNEWFRQSDGRRESYPSGFDPNVGAYTRVTIPPPARNTPEGGGA